MARPDGTNPSDSGSVRIHYEIPVQLHRRAKAEAALRGVTLKRFLIEVLEQAVDHQPKAPGHVTSTKKR